jgi:hypothetical protein
MDAVCSPFSAIISLCLVPNMPNNGDSHLYISKGLNVRCEERSDGFSADKILFST